MKDELVGELAPAQFADVVLDVGVQPWLSILHRQAREPCRDLRRPDLAEVQMWR
jgi:hypothetical protein